jgi:DNA-binding transcriptional LysR family regulator
MTLGSRLPSFSSLIAFDAAARHGSFTLAARELNVSQPAVSRRIAVLEADLGMAMFAREIRPLRLTANGKSLFDAWQASMGRLEEAVEHLRNVRPGNSITIGATSCFASYWLLPRWPKLQAAFSNHSLRLLTGDLSDESDKVDVRVEFGSGRRENVGRILQEKVYCVCSPTYLQGRPRMLSLAELRESQLLRLGDEQKRWYSWKTWFAALGQNVREDKLKTIRLDDYSLIIEAALAGRGIALGWNGLLDSLLSNGSLVRVTNELAQSSRGYYVSCLNQEHEATREVCNWMLAA